MKGAPRCRYWGARVVAGDLSLERSFVAMEDALALQRAGKLRGGVVPFPPTARRRVWKRGVLAAGLVKTAQATIVKKLGEAMSLRELQLMYKKLALTYHPDKCHMSGYTAAQATQLFKHLCAVYEACGETLS